MSGMVGIVLVGIGGYGVNYVNELLDNYNRDSFKIVGVVDPYAENCARLSELTDIGVKIYDSLDKFYKEQSADLAIISSPIHLHCKQTVLCLEHGTNVLCEKPLAGSVEDGLEMAEAEKKSDAFVAIGYQWSFSEAIQDLKKDIMSGLLGKPIRLKTYVAWPRKKSYYKRNNWAGKMKAADGTWILDSPANNATAHYLHNMFYVLGKTRESSVRPVSVRAELYRANDIENYDTVAMRVNVEYGAEILFYATHVVSETVGPLFVYEFDKGVVEFGFGDVIEAKFADGSSKKYSDSKDEGMVKLWDCIKAVRMGGSVACGIDAALSQLFCISAAQESMPDIMVFPKNMIIEEEDGGDTLTWVPGLEKSLYDCFNNNILPSESGELDWAGKAGKNIVNYK